MGPGEPSCSPTSIDQRSPTPTDIRMFRLTPVNSRPTATVSVISLFHPLGSSHIPMGPGMTSPVSTPSGCLTTLLISRLMTFRLCSWARIYIIPNRRQHLLVPYVTPCIPSFIQQTLLECLLCSSHRAGEDSTSARDSAGTALLKLPG